MATFNQVTLVGRLTRDPQTKSFSNGGKVAELGFAVSDRKKDQSSGQWVDSPVFIDCKAFNSQNGQKLADICEQYLRKGSQALLSGRLSLETWEKDGQKRSKLVVIVQAMQLLDPRQDGDHGAGRQAEYREPARSAPEQSPDAPGEELGNIPF